MQLREPCKRFFSALIDYAGLFPPAALDLSHALQNYRKYLNSADAWMLGTFIIPTALLDKLSPDQPGDFSEHAPLHLSVLAGDSTEIQTIRHRLQAASHYVKLAVIETKFPEKIELDPLLGEMLHAAGYADRPLFIELPARPDWDAQLPVAVEHLAVLAEKTGIRCGLKLRCGGTTPDMVPGTARMSSALKRCAQAELPLKFTAGLHHPFRHHADDLGTMVHGYFNIFFAGMLAARTDISDTDLQQILGHAESPVHADDDTLSWLGFTLDTGDIANSRNRHTVSFGSCSFIEPVADARARGWI